MARRCYERPAGRLSLLVILSFAALFVIALVTAGCRGEAEDRGPAPMKPAARGNAEAGIALIGRFECNRCHEGALMAPVAQNKHCFQCHRDIMAGTMEAPADAMVEWRERVQHLTAAPSLVDSTKHYRRDWIARFLLEPSDIRPHLTATMPRLAISPEEALDIATALAPSDEASRVSFEGADAARGKALMDAKSCGSCHVFSGAPPLADRPSMPRPPLAVALAPDLRATRDRLRPDGLVAWLRDPAAVKPGTLMPSSSLTEGEARDIALYLLTVPLAKAPVAEAPARLPVLKREVTFDEVSQRVLRRTCWHCHGEPDYARGEGGPGNTGGFGFPGRGLSLADYDGVASGMLDEKGERHSVLSAGEDGTPMLVRSLLARREEELGRPAAGVRGMPLGLPALSPEEIQLVESWIVQGRRQ